MTLKLRSLMVGVGLALAVTPANAAAVKIKVEDGKKIRVAKSGTALGTQG